MNPHVRYHLRPGEWRPDPPRVSYGCDRSGIIALLGEELSASAWTHGESDAGPTIEVRGRKLEVPPSAEDIAYLESIATPAPYGRGEDTLLDPAVRDALQVGAEHVTLGGAPWERLRDAMLRTIATDMGLDDASPRLDPLKLLLYRTGGHFTMHADTEKTPGMVASLTLIMPGAYEGGTLVLEHAGERLGVGAGGAPPVALGRVVCRLPALPRAGGERNPSRDDLRSRDRPRDTARGPRGDEPRARMGAVGTKLRRVAHRVGRAGRDRDLARVLADDACGEACHLGWLQIREVGPAQDEEGGSWGDHTVAWYEPEEETDDDPPPESMVNNDWFSWTEDDPAPYRIAHRETPELHLRDVARQNVWVEALRSLDGKATDHGPIEVMDGETVPPGALGRAVPDGARLYEATGNEGASLELRYRRAVLVMWRRNKATLRMLARCGGRLALAVECTQRDADQRKRYSHEGGLEAAPRALGRGARDRRRRT